MVAALTTVAIAPAQPVTRYVDGLGSIVVGGYLVWSGLRMAQPYLGDFRALFQHWRERSRSIAWSSVRKDND